MAVSAGPNVVKDSDYQVHLCTGSGTFLPNFTGTVEVLVVAGGGGGGMDMGGGGGGGGVLTSTTYAVTAGSPITVTVGAGGVGAPAGGPPNNSNFHQFVLSATSGSNSVFGSLTAVGGGYGGSSYFGYTPNYGYGANGGSGGGASGYSDGNTGRNGSGTGGQGNAGGSSIGQYYSGGGGGAGAAGSNGGTANGGAGVLNNILGGGKNLYWAGGGGGAGYSSGTGGSGGAGGGGGGASGGTGDTNGLNPARNAGTGGGGDWVDTPGGDGGRNTGGGGGGGMHYNRNNRGGNGGSGAVIIRHLKSAGTSTFNGLADNRSSMIFCMDPANTGKGLSVEVLVVGGGGGGGMDMGGGGGAGGVVSQQNLQVQINSPMSVTVGAGGNGSPGTYGASPVPGYSGSNSSIGNIVAYGGGGGGSGHYIDGYATYSEGTSGPGGSAGGDSPEWGRNRGMGTDPAPLDVPQGYGGGAAGANGDGSYAAGGGGGATRPGWGGRGSWRAGNGGDGFQSSIAGTSYYYGGGGGGSGWTNTAGSGGAGGGGGGSVTAGHTPGSGDTNGYNAGGNGAAATNSNGGNGGANTGGGGGGGTHYASIGGNGGSGIVIVRYYGSQQATGGTVSSSGGYTVHTFTSSGTFTPTATTGIRDISGYNFNLTLIGVTRSESNQGSLDFNGSTYINLDTNIQAGSTFASYEFWCKPTTIPGSGYNQLYIQESSTWIALYNPSGTAAFGIDLNNGSGWFDNNGGFNTGARTTSSLSANNIYHVFYSWDGSTVRVYLNGILESTTSTLQASNGRQNVTQLGPGTTHRNIGSRYSGAGNQWVGSIYSVKFYNKAFTASEVFQNFTVLRGRFGI